MFFDPSPASCYYVSSSDPSPSHLPALLPTLFQADPPTPASTKVFLDPSPVSRYYVSSYGGFTTESKVLQEARDALGRLDKAGLKEGQDFDSSVYFSAGYDSPFRLLNRHNEVGQGVEPWGGGGGREAPVSCLWVRQRGGGTPSA